MVAQFLRLTTAGATLAVAVLAGLFAGSQLADRTGERWWPIAGLIGGLAAGIGVVVGTYRSSMRRRGTVDPQLAPARHGSQEGTIPGVRNTTSAASAAELRAYEARKRSIRWRPLLALCVVAAIIAVWRPSLGLDLAIGGVCGVANVLLIMGNNERLVDGRRSRAMFAAGNMFRIISVAAVPVIVASHGPWWSMGIYFAGFFTPLAWYSVELQRWYRRGT